MPVQGIIQRGFAATGLVPYDPNQVLSRLCTQLRTPTPPTDLPRSKGKWIPETPHNVTELELQAKAIKGYIQRRTQSPPSLTDLALNQLVKRPSNVNAQRCYSYGRE